MDENFDFEKEENTKRKLLTALVAFACIVLLAFLAASLIKTFVTETFTVDGSSMDYTLTGGVAGNYDDGDRVVVNRFGKINRGCIIVLRLPNRENALVKRVIGVGGDKIKIVNGALFVNGIEQHEDYVAEENKIIYAPNENMDEITVMDGYVFVMGDNRNYSSDSREFGQIPLSNVEGKVFIILKESGGFKFV